MIIIRTMRIKITAFAMIALLCLAGGGMRVAAQAPTGTNYNNCVFWNVALGDVILLPDKSIGYTWNSSSKTWVYTTNGGSSSDKLQYIVMVPNGTTFDGNPTHLTHATKPVTKPSGGTVAIVNQSSANVATVLNNWKTRATAQGHPSSGYRIIIACNVRYTVCIDNVWSTYQDQSPDRMTGGLAFYPQSDGATLNLYMVGDNRFGNVFYCSRWINIDKAFTDKDGNKVGYKKFSGDIPSNFEYDFTTAQCVFHSAASTGSKSGTLVVGNITPGKTNGASYFGHETTYNFYDAVIGGSDNPWYQDSRGIKITGGTIYAGAEPTDVCSAIGGGGNGYGLVTITGGSVTAVTSSTGTAIGGGIGWTDYGGQASVTISGGEVYAYNHGIVRDYPVGQGNKFVPAAAIGGGSSFEKKCKETTVTISGGTVYAQSVGGVAIGGGGSAMGDGGNAVIKISGSADVKAKSISGSQNGVTIPYGSSIGGGVGGDGGHGFGNGDGGTCTFTMSGGKLMAGSVGGGSNNSTHGGKIGYAKATISGASTDIQAQFIMAKGGSQACTFTMSGGKIHNSSINSTDYKLVKQDGGAVWIDDTGAVVNITGGSIENCTAQNGGAIYTSGGSISITGGSGIKSCTATTGHGGAIYTKGGTVTIKKNITDCVATAGNGGAVAIMATGANVTLENTKILRNTAKKYGGAFYLNKNAKVTITNGTIDNNTATSNDGGAFYGNTGSEITLNSGSIENNKARNGGGVYLASGAKLTYKMTSSTGYIRGNQASAWGGGVFLAQGTTDAKTTLTFTGTSSSLGFYDNIAGTGADDIYADGEGTTYINFPNVNNMDLGGYSLPGATLEWWEDYQVNDSRYNLGTQQKAASDGIRRYRASRDADQPIYKVTPQTAFYTKYLALTLGFEYGVMEIRRAGLKPRENAIYKVEFQGSDLNRPTQYVVVLGTEDSEKTTIGSNAWNISKLKYLPKGTYKVTEISWTWYNANKTSSALVKTQDITNDGVGNRIYEFVNDHKDLGTAPLHDEELKVNELKAN